ncbi:hypothetical protein GCM10025868_11220 [Angustibacter aerolatus]|uniref:Uncharacterized protein n=1 Tax=Angustibacter aerolatus TaxID=1162965 RepID=A0ABQ6JCH2_9ACTN|nr:hypothetical protein [Angustibacter aerolatus]GMA85872.1 hypothetical protein GCM10025868_11220 [Angustibacter aerolatus]
MSALDSRPRAGTSKWFSATHALNGVVPDDIAREHQARLAEQAQRVEGQIAGLSTTDAMTQQVIEAACRIAAEVGAAYGMADDNVRREFNRSGSARSPSTRATTRCWSTTPSGPSLAKG